MKFGTYTLQIPLFSKIPLAMQNSKMAAPKSKMSAQKSCFSIITQNALILSPINVLKLNIKLGIRILGQEYLFRGHVRTNIVKVQPFLTKRWPVVNPFIAIDVYWKCTVFHFLKIYSLGHPDVWLWSTDRPRIDTRSRNETVLCFAHSRESWLVSFPPLSNMLKFSGLSRLIWGRSRQERSWPPPSLPVRGGGGGGGAQGRLRLVCFSFSFGLDGASCI